MEEKKIDKKIKKLRKKLCKIGKSKLKTEEVLKISQRLDRLIYQVMKEKNE